MICRHTNELLPFNKSILQDNVSMPSYPAALVNSKKYQGLTPEAPVFLPNGVLTTTPYKTVQKDYAMEYARLSTPINTEVTSRLSADKISRLPLIFKEGTPKDQIIKDTNVEQIEVNPDETRYATKPDKNFLNTPEAVEMKYTIDPSIELPPRHRQLFRNVDSEYNNMLPIYLRNQEYNTRPKPLAGEWNTKNKEHFENTKITSRNELYAKMWNYNNPEHDEKESYTNIDSSTNNFAKRVENMSLTDKLESYSNDSIEITNTDDLNEVDNDIYARKESFSGATNYTTSVESYMSVLTSQATALICFVKQNKDFAPWNKYWDFLDKNIHKCGKNILFKQLECSDADVAFVQNKGEQMKFRIRDSMRFVPISIFTYVLIHEMAHLANGEEWGHGPRFQQLMHLLELAGFEIGILKVKDYPEEPYYSGETQILTKQSIKNELYDAIQEIVNCGGNNKFYSDLHKKIYNL